MSLTFNGTSSNLSVASRLIPAAYPFAEFGWVKPRTSSATAFAFGLGSATAGESEFCAYVDGGGAGKVRAWSSYGGANGTVNSTTGVTTSWQPVLIVHNSATSCDIYYANGVKVSGNTGQAPSFSLITRFAIGSRPTLAGFFFDGDIAEVALWSSALGQADFDALAAGAYPESVQSASLVESWSLQTQAVTQTGTKGAVLTGGASTTQGATHPITRTPTTTIGGTVGAAAAAGSPATIYGTVTVGCSVAAAAASGAQASYSNGVPTTTINGAVGSVSASGATAGFGTFLQTDVMPNNTGSILSGTAVVWTWTPNGRVGSMAGLTTVDGTGTTDANGRLAPGIAIATGRLSVAVRNASAKQDDVFEQYF